jgi:hypothetical protein
MLDLNHPQSQSVFAAARHTDAILELSKLKTLVPTPQRAEILARIEYPISRLRKLNRERFGASSFIDRAISDLEAGCRAIAESRSSESRLDGRGNCPVCGSQITHLPHQGHDMTYCGTCLERIFNARQRLASRKGFCTFAI